MRLAWNKQRGWSGGKKWVNEMGARVRFLVALLALHLSQLLQQMKRRLQRIAAVTVIIIIIITAKMNVWRRNACA